MMYIGKVRVSLVCACLCLFVLIHAWLPFSRNSLATNSPAAALKV